MIEELVEFSEDPNKTLELFAAYGSWKKREEILPLLVGEDSGKKEDKESQKLDLQPLPTELKYAYLEEGSQCLVVISSSLNASQEDSLFGTLRKFKRAIGWKISNLKGISPLVFTHHIYMEDEAKLVRQP